jgi:hypothetical protein
VAGTIGQIVAGVPNGFSLSPPQETKGGNISLFCLIAINKGINLNSCNLIVEMICYLYKKEIVAITASEAPREPVAALD